jgi:imidazolonepropionase-like amidohydrolase
LRLDVFREFGIAPRAFHHAVEAYKIRDRLRAAGVGAVVWADWYGFKLELLDAVPTNAALLDEAGVRVALHSDSPDDIQRLNQQAAKALAAGLRAGIPVDRERALRWITANPAWVLGIDGRVGTLEAGKDADLVVWSRDPLSVYARAEQVFIAGRRVWARGDSKEPRSDFELGLRGEP